MKKHDLKKLYTVLPNDPDNPDGVRKYFQRIIESLPNNVYWLNRQCMTMGCNRNTLKLVGLERLEDFIGINYEEMAQLAHWTKGQAESFKRDDMEVMETGIAKVNVEEPPLFSEDGEPIYYMSTRVPLFDENGTVIGVVGISVDITEKKNAELALIKANKKAEAASRAKSEFIANMSHDIRTPITGILGVMQKFIYDVESVESEFNKNPSFTELKKLFKETLCEVQHDATLGLSATQQLLQLLNEILEVVQIESGKVNVKPEAFDIRALVQQNIELLQPVATQQGLALHAEIGKTVPQYVRGLRRYLNRSLLNLISNALKFTKAGSVTVTVAVAEDQGDAVTLTIKVTDTGIGIPPDKFDTIFEHFSRLTPSYENNYAGSGLGLYTVKHYVEMMQGKIAVHSELGQGTTFTLTLPLEITDHADALFDPNAAVLQHAAAKQPIASPATTQAVSTDEGAAHPSAYVLIVEDNPMAAGTAKMTLKRLQCRCDLATSGQEAVEHAQQNLYDFILMDIGLPDFSGIEATHQIRAFDAVTPIIALTGHVGDAQQRACLAAGMNQVLIKPAPVAAIQALLQQYVSPETTTATATPPDTAHSDASVAIDWDGCLKLYDGDEAFVRDSLAIMDTDLKKTAAILDTAYAQMDVIALRDELHRALGGIVYLKLPRLETAFRAFHTCIKKERANRIQCDKRYAELKDALQAFHDQWQALV